MKREKTLNGQTLSTASNLQKLQLSKMIDQQLKFQQALKDLKSDLADYGLTKDELNEQLAAITLDQELETKENSKQHNFVES